MMRTTTIKEKPITDNDNYVNIGLNAQSIERIAAMLNILLADEHVIYILERNAHWNVTGADFSSMHTFFENLYAQTETRIDEVAERIRSIGDFPAASLQEFMKLTQLAETLTGSNRSETFISELLSCHENTIQYIRKNISKISVEYGDEGTADFLTGLMESHEKTAWMLRAHL